MENASQNAACSELSSPVPAISPLLPLIPAHIDVSWATKEAPSLLLPVEPLYRMSIPEYAIPEGRRKRHRRRRHYKEGLLS